MDCAILCEETAQKSPFDNPGYTNTLRSDSAWHRFGAIESICLSVRKTFISQCFHKQETVERPKTNVPRICEEFGGDPNAVFLCGFSRGAIATNFIGLHDDEIAKLWTAFITHDHFDGEREWRGKSWGSPLAAYRKTSLQRLNRLNGRPYLVCQAGGAKRIADYLKTVTALESFTFVDVNTQKIPGKFPNEFAIHSHTDRWLLKDSAERQMVWAWIDRVLAASHQ